MTLLFTNRLLLAPDCENYHVSIQHTFVNIYIPHPMEFVCLHRVQQLDHPPSKLQRRFPAINQWNRNMCYLNAGNEHIKTVKEVHCFGKNFGVLKIKYETRFVSLVWNKIRDKCLFIISLMHTHITAQHYYCKAAITNRKTQSYIE